MNDCIVDAHRTARAAVAQCGHLPCVPDRGTSLIAPDTDPRQTWVVEVVVEGDAVPAPVLEVLARQGLALVDCERQVPHVIVTAEVPRR